MDVAVREASFNDAPEIARLSNLLGYAISVADTLKNLQMILTCSNDTTLVAVTNGKIVGWIHVFYTIRIESGSFCEIGGLVIDAQYRQKGIGKLLVDHVKRWCISKKTSSLRVRCNVKRKGAHEFYRRAGFVEAKQQAVFELVLPIDS